MRFGLSTGSFTIFLSTINLLNVRCSILPFNEFERNSLYLPGPPNSISQHQNHQIEKRDVREMRPNDIRISNFNVQSDIRYRYSCTYFTSTVVNEGQEANEVSFQVVLPETGFISKFVMEVDGRSYEAYVKEKAEAKQIYNEAQYRGQSAGLVELNSRHSNIFNVNINIQSHSSVRFNLTYEELLQRKLGRYELIINISPNQVFNVENVGIIVTIEESNKLKIIQIPKLKYNELEIEDENLVGHNIEADIKQPEVNKARIIWIPSQVDVETLKRTGKIGKFIVRYDIEREGEAGEVLVMNGYFVHFFAPPNLKSLRKHIVFILDISGSMSGRKIEQLKEAMKKILSDLKSEDYFNILIFLNEVTHWGPNHDFTTRRERISWFEDNPVRRIPDTTERQPYPASRKNIEKAQEFIQSLNAGGGTNINEALLQGLIVTRFINQGKESLIPKDAQSMIIFLTDGEPTVGITNPNEIQRNVRNSNQAQSVPIFSLAFGQDADFGFVKKISLQNFGFARKIYEAADAKLQLQGFYKEISSPLLRDVKFRYTGDDYEIHETTTITFNTLFDGNEIIIAGRVKLKNYNVARVEADSTSTKMASSYPTVLDGHSEALFTRYYPINRSHFPVEIYGCGRDAQCTTWRQPVVYSYRIWPWHCPLPYHPTEPPPPPAPISKEDYFLERFWAYLTIQQLIDQDFAADETSSNLKQKALKLALQYGFVTPLTSLVVVKPEEILYLAEPVPIDDFSRQSAGISRSSLSMARRKMSSGSSGPVQFFGGGDLRGNSGNMMASPAAMKNMNTADAAPSSGQADMGGTSVTSSKSELAAAAPAQASNTSSSDKKTTEDKSISTFYGLNDIEWLRTPPFTVDIEGQDGVKKTYEIAKITVGQEMQVSEKKCTIHRDGVKTFGQCKHLKDCVQDEFRRDFEAYAKSYFCEAETKNKDYAGACCPT